MQNDEESDKSKNIVTKYKIKLDTKYVFLNQVLGHHKS